MSLSRATSPDGTSLAPGPTGPFPCEVLRPLQGVPFRLPCEDPWIEEGGSPAHTYLEAAQDAWEDAPEWMDFLDLGSPAYDIKRAARDLYLNELEPLLPTTRTVLEVGCGIGRITQCLLDAGLAVHGVDADLQSLQRCAWHAAGRPGALDLHWSTPAQLPPIEADLAVAVEVLCYLESPVDALRAMASHVRSGGHVFLSMEARYGWAASQDAPPDGLDVALGSGDTLLHLEEDRYVHLYDRAGMQRLVESAGLIVERIVPTHYLTDGPLEDLLPLTASREELLAMESRIRSHPVWGPLNRIWTVTARKP